MAVEKDKRQTAEITPEASGDLDSLCDWTDLPRKYVVERLIRWAAKQDHDLMGAILHSLPAHREADFAKLLLEEMAAEQAPPLKMRRKDAAKGDVPGKGKGKGEGLSAEDLQDDED